MYGSIPPGHESLPPDATLWALTLFSVVTLLLLGANLIWSVITGRIVRPSRSQRRADAKRARSERGRTASRSAMARAEPASVRPLAVTQEQQDVQALAEVRARRAEARRARVVQRKLARERPRAARARAYEDALRRQDLLRREAALERAENLRRREEEARRREEAFAAAPAQAPLSIIDLSSWGVAPQTQPLADRTSTQPGEPAGRR